MKCHNCGSESEGLERCPNCGSALVFGNINVNMPAQNNMQQMNNNYHEEINNVEEKKKSKLPLIIILLVVIIIGVVIYFMVFSNKNNESGNESSVGEQNEVSSGNFYMPITGVQKSNDTVTISGVVENGSAKVGDKVSIVGLGKKEVTGKIKSVTAVDTNFKKSEVATKGGTANIVLEGISSNDIEKGQVLITPSSIKTYTDFEATVKVKEDKINGLSISTGDVVKLKADTFEVEALVTFEKNKYYIMNGESTSATIKLNKNLPLSVGKTLLIYVDNTNIGSIEVTKLLKDNSTNDLEQYKNKIVQKVKDFDYGTNGLFLMNITDVYSVSDKGTFVEGNVFRGTINLNDEVEIIGLDKKSKKSVITSMSLIVNGKEKVVNKVSAGQKVKIGLRKVDHFEVEYGQSLVKAGSMKAHKKLQATIRFYTKEQGGKTTPILNNYKPVVYFFPASINCTVKFNDKKDKVNPGDEVSANIELEESVASEAGMVFYLKERNKIVATGKITKVLD